jgi:RimJ/RimL family protein N-acetyltransferase
MYTHKDGIKLRKIHKGDLHSLLKLKEESWWGTHSTLIVNIEDQLRWYESISNNQLYMIAENVEGKSIGIACYTDIDWFGRSLNISGSIYKEFRKMDVVKSSFSCGLDFAFEVLNMQRVGAEVLETHSAAQHLEIGHLGFKVEGRRRRSAYKAGKYYDSILLGLLREEWDSQKRVQDYSGCCNNNFDHDKAQECIDRFNKILVPPAPNLDAHKPVVSFINKSYSGSVAAEKGGI